MTGIDAVARLECEMRMSEYLKRELGLSHSLIVKVKYGGVYLNGVAVTMRATVRDGDRVEVKFPVESSEGIEPIDIPIEVLYEDEYLIAVSKPTNMPTAVLYATIFKRSGRSISPAISTGIISSDVERKTATRVPSLITFPT